MAAIAPTGRPGARLVDLPGADHWPWLGPVGAVLDAVDAFLADLG